MNENNSDVHSGIWVAITLALVALVFSVAAVANLCPRTQHDFDYLGLLVGILGLIVTVLLGWNIYSLIDLKGVKSELQNAKDEIERRAAEAMAVSLMQNAIAMDGVNNNSLPTVFLAFNAIGVLIPRTDNDENLADRARQEAINMLHNIIEQGIEIECTPEDHRRYLAIATYINDPIIIDWVSRFHRTQP